MNAKILVFVTCVEAIIYLIIWFIIIYYYISYYYMIFMTVPLKKNISFTFLFKVTKTLNTVVFKCYCIIKLFMYIRSPQV